MGVLPTSPRPFTAVDGGTALGACRVSRQIGGVRAIIVSRVYADPAARGKLKALAGLGVAVAAAVPDRWIPAGLSHEQLTSWDDDSGVRAVPIPSAAAPRHSPIRHGTPARCGVSCPICVPT